MKSDRSLFWSIWHLGLTAFVIAVDVTLIWIAPATVHVIALALTLILFLVDFLTASYLGVVGIVVVPVMMYVLSVSESAALMSGVLFSGYAIGRLNLLIASGWLIKCVHHSGNSSIEEISLLGSQEGWLFVKSQGKWKLSDFQVVKGIPNSNKIKLHMAFSSIRTSGKMIKSLDLCVPGRKSVFATARFGGKIVWIASLVDLMKNEEKGIHDR